MDSVKRGSRLPRLLQLVAKVEGFHYPLSVKCSCVANRSQLFCSLNDTNFSSMKISRMVVDRENPQNYISRKFVRIR